jgi:hypothetical protein
MRTAEFCTYSLPRKARNKLETICQA